MKRRPLSDYMIILVIMLFLAWQVPFVIAQDQQDQVQLPDEYDLKMAELNKRYNELNVQARAINAEKAKIEYAYRMLQAMKAGTGEGALGSGLPGVEVEPADEPEQKAEDD